MKTAYSVVHGVPKLSGLPRFSLLLIALLAGCGAEVSPTVEAPANAEAATATEGLSASKGQPLEAASDSPNLVLISIDTLRADRVGQEESITPSIDRLAREGTVFDRAMTPIGTTLPALATILTGLHPREHAIQWNGHTLRPEFTTLAEVFQENDYATAAFVSYFDAVHIGGLGQGFDTRVERPDRPLANLPAQEVNRQALAWLREPRTQPIFFWVHYFEPHSPYRMTDYARERLSGLTGLYQNGASVEDFYRFNDPGMNTPENREILNILYDGEVFEVDRAVGEILDAVDRLDSGRPMVVVLTADHGQLLGEHDAVGHGFGVWEEILHIPMIVRDSRREGGRRVSTRVGLVDLFPTLVELAGLEVSRQVSGRSFVPALDGERMSERHYYAETRIPPPPPLQTAILYGDRKLQRFEGDVSAYDLGADPKELRRGRLEADDRELLRRLERFGTRQATASIDDDSLDADEEGRNARLVALGYAAGSISSTADTLPELSITEAVEIIQAFGDLLKEVGRGRDGVLDESRLAHPKSRIKAALLLVMDATTEGNDREFLRSAALTLAFFQASIGDEARPLDTMGPGQHTWRSIVEAEMKSMAIALAKRGH